MWGALALLTTWTGDIPPFQLVAMSFAIAFALALGKWVICVAIFVSCPGKTLSQEAEKADSNAAKAADEEAEPAYPLSVAVLEEDVYVVDLDLPGVWKSGNSRELFVRGSNLLRKNDCSAC